MRNIKHIKASVIPQLETQKESKRTLKQLEREKEDAEKLENILEEINENDISLKFRTIFDLEAEINSRREIVEKYDQWMFEKRGNEALLLMYLLVRSAHEIYDGMPVLRRKFDTPPPVPQTSTYILTIQRDQGQSRRIRMVKKLENEAVLLVLCGNIGVHDE